MIYCLFVNPKTYFSLSSFLCFLSFILYPVSFIFCFVFVFLFYVH